MSLVLKIKIGKGDIRRTQIDRPKSFADLHGSLVKYLDLASKPEFENFRILYEDDEKDLISLMDDADLQEALRQVDSSTSKILRLTVKSNHASKHRERSEHRGGGRPSRCGRHHHQAQPQMGHPFGPLLEMARASLPDLLNNPALRGMAEGMMSSGSVKVVTNYMCDNCNNQISGDRFTSTTNSNFDLCSVCMKSAVGEKLNEEHQFKKVSALESLVECLSKGGTFDASFAEGQAQQDVPVSHHALCDKCDQNIVGIRHKCMDCADYDECNVCRTAANAVAHAEGHKFYAIEDAKVRRIPEDVLKSHQAEKEAVIKAKEAEEAASKAREEEERAKEQARISRLTAVKPKPCAKPVVVPQVEEREPSAFEKNLQTLESMGFTDRKKNIQVLVRNRNKLFESIQELLQ